MERCYFHSIKEAEHQCIQCQKQVCGSCAILVEGEPYCQLCWDGIVTKMKRKAAEEQILPGIPWLQRRELGLAPAFLRTARQVLFEPSRFFSRMPPGADLGAPLLFAIICILIFWYPMNLFYIKIVFPPLLNQIQAQTLEIAPETDSNPAALRMSKLSERFQTLSKIDILMMTLNSLVSYILAASAIQHLLVNLFRGRQGFKTTLEIRCYSMTVQCLWLIPIVGIVLAELVSLIVCARGFQTAQHLSFPQALLVASIPVVLSLAAAAAVF
ncbi:MAG: Yip1 family protein [Candidatus Omnitrophota bacterium]